MSEKALIEKLKWNKLETKLMMLLRDRNLKLLRESMHPQEAETIQVSNQEHLVNNLDHHSAKTSKSNQDKLINHKSKRGNTAGTK